jgi:hydroxyacylglutathione hydrolase
MNIIDDNVIRITRLTLGPYETNTYIVACGKTHQSLVVDAPAGTSEIIAALEGTEPRFILLTHDHEDHTGVMVSLHSRLKVPLAAHELDSYKLKTPPEILLKNGDEIKLGNLKIEVLHTPGHTTGSLCLKTGKYLFAGDTIFPGGPGHTETPEDFKQIIASITQKILSLPDDTLLLPGHGDGTTVKKAREEYNVFASKLHDEFICGDVTWLSS